jgi:hypothetical protein
MVDVPPVLPVTIPAASTVATVVLLLLQVPPVVVLVSVVVCPAHTIGVPPIAAGEAITVTTIDAVQPVPIV